MTDTATLSQDFEEIENCWIPMPDGARLSARLWIPHGARERPVAVILEYIPYGKRDGTRERDEGMHRYFAAHGYAAARIDLRGTGESDGVLLDEYLDQEIDDGLAAIAWIAAQDWCNGRVGMIGKSWGGFNALQVASRRPAALKAVISVCAADDRYTDDAHYMGGCLLNENQIWGSVLFTLSGMAPDPELAGENWRSLWHRRLEATQPPPLTWLEHQRRDEYWRHGSVCEDYAAIQCPVYAVGGWADGYSNAIPRLLANLSAPCKALIGPWGHQYPHEGLPGPAIGFLREALRWWDCWLRDIDTGVMREPVLRAWMPDLAALRSGTVAQTGRWVAENCWPSRRIESLRLYPGAGGLSRKPQAPGELRIRSQQDTGLAAGGWCLFGHESELPRDQRDDDARSLCFDLDPLSEPMELLGAPQLTLCLASDQPIANLIARLNWVADDGVSTRLTYGVLNLAHRAGHANPRAMEPGRFTTIRLGLNDLAVSLPAGARLRLALSTAYWPLLWPPPVPATLTVESSGSVLELPVRPPAPADAQLPEFGPGEAAPVDAATVIRAAESSRSITHDPHTGITHYVNRTEMDANGRVGLAKLESIDLVSGQGLVEHFQIRADDPLSARAHIVQEVVSERAGWRVSVTTELELSADREHFRLQAKLVAREGESEVFERRWNERIARDNM